MNPCLPNASWENTLLAHESLYLAATNETSGDDTQYHLAKFMHKCYATSPRIRVVNPVIWS